MVNCFICDPKSKFIDCICNKEFLLFNETCSNFTEKEELLKFSVIKPWTISTITACCNFNSRIDVKKYTDFYGCNLNRKKFYNCIHCYIGVKYQNKNKK